MSTTPDRIFDFIVHNHLYLRRTRDNLFRILRHYRIPTHRDDGQLDNVAMGEIDKFIVAAGRYVRDQQAQLLAQNAAGKKLKLTLK